MANPPALKRKLGSFSYILTAIALTFERSGRHLSIAADDRPELFLTTLASDNPVSIYRFGFPLITSTIPTARGIPIRQARRIEVVSETAVPCQVDGDAAGETSLAIEQTGQLDTNRRAIGAAALLLPVASQDSTFKIHRVEAAVVGIPIDEFPPGIR